MPRLSPLIMISLFLAFRLMAADVHRELLKADRKVGKQPTYLDERPLYGLVIVGPSLKTRMWMVLDKSSPAERQYDILYVDLNGNHDLTDKAERFVTAADKDGESRFVLPNITDPDTGETHTEFSLRCAAPDTAYQMITIKWKGKQKIGGGYTDDPDKETYSRFADSPDKAPVLWLNGDGPFTFQRWYTEPLQIGHETDVSLFIGVPGVGTSTFCAFQIHALPQGEGIQGILHYTANDGAQRQKAFALLNKC